MAQVEATAAHEAYLEELKACLASSGALIPADELLAITSQFVGMLLAMQDQHSMTAQQTMGIVGANLQIGNQTAIEFAMQGKPN